MKEKRETMNVLHLLQVYYGRHWKQIRFVSSLILAGCFVLGFKAMGGKVGLIHQLYKGALLGLLFPEVVIGLGAKEILIQALDF